MAWNPCSPCRGFGVRFGVDWLFVLRGIRTLLVLSKKVSAIFNTDKGEDE
jgi:hypothetical protein